MTVAVLGTINMLMNTDQIDIKWEKIVLTIYQKMVNHSKSA